MTKGEWIFSAGLATGLGLGIALCLKGIFGGAPHVTPFPQPLGPLGFYERSPNPPLLPGARGNYGDMPGRR